MHTAKFLLSRHALISQTMPTLRARLSQTNTHTHTHTRTHTHTNTVSQCCPTHNTSIHTTGWSSFSLTVSLPLQTFLLWLYFSFCAALLSPFLKLKHSFSLFISLSLSLSLSLSPSLDR